MCCVSLGKELPEWDLQRIHTFNVFVAGKSALADPGREIQPIDLVGVMEVDVRFPLINRWDFNGATGVAFIDGRASSRG